MTLNTVSLIGPQFTGTQTEHLPKHHEKEKTMSNTYFGDDGNYGPAKGIIILDTSNWEPEMWREIIDVEDTERSSLAVHFSSGVHLWKDAMCNICGLTPFELGVPEV